MLIGLFVALSQILVRMNGWLQFLDLLAYDLLITVRATDVTTEPGACL